MKIAGEYSFDAPRPMVWDALQDPEVLTSVMPGCEQLELVGENEYEGALNIKVGPVQGKFKGNIKLRDIVEPEGYTMEVDGRGNPGFVKATAKVSLSEEGEGTKMAYDSDAQVGGRIAGVGQRLIDSSAKAIIKQSLDGLNETMKARLAADQGGGGDAAPVAAPKAPSQSEFAANVAKEVAKDLVPKPVLIILVILILALLAWIVF